MDLPRPNGVPSPPPNNTVAVPNARPNYSYFLFLSLMFYLLNSNSSSSISTFPTTTPQVSTNSSEPNLYTQARNRLLLREARYKGLENWINDDNNVTSVWLNSTYFSDVNPRNESTRRKITPFEPFVRIEPKVVVDEGGLSRLMHRDVLPERYPQLEEGGKIYPQNLTGFVKASWTSQDWSFQQLGSNETWQVVEEIRATSPNSNETLVDNDRINSTISAAQNPQSLVRRQEDRIFETNSTTTPMNASIPSNSTLSNTITTTYNRTLLRGSFPFTYRPPPSHRRNKALFNLRELKTSSTGPLLPTQDFSSDDELLVLKPLDDSSNWKDWEKKGAVTYLGGDLSLSIEDANSPSEFVGKQTNLDIEAAHLVGEGLLYGYATPSFVRSHLVETVSLPFYNSDPLDPSWNTTTGRDANVTAKAIGMAMVKETGRRLQNDVDHLDENVAERERNGSQGSEDSFDPDTPQCIFRFYGSLDPLPHPYTLSLYREFYSSMTRPTGSSLPPPPSQTLRFILSSTNCGLVLQGHGTLLPTPILWTRTKDFALWIGVAQFVVVVSLVRHLERVATRPGTMANCASGTVGIGCIVDAYVFVLLLTAGVVTASTRSSLPLFIPSFLALLSSLLFGMRYVSLIRAATPIISRPTLPTPTPAATTTVNVPAVIPSPTTTTTTTTTTTSREELAARAAERRARGEVEREEEGDDDNVEEPLITPPPTMTTTTDTAVGNDNGWIPIPASEQVILGLMVLSLVVGTAIILRWGWIALICTVVYSYWIPQIVLNVQRGTARQSFTIEFIVATTLARLCLPVYFYAYEDNVLDVDTSPWIYILILYNVLQASILILQSRPSFGARFFLPQRTLDYLDLVQVNQWDYHQPLSRSKRDDIEQSLREEGSLEKGPSCPICMDTISINLDNDDKKTTQDSDDIIIDDDDDSDMRQLYALTPCGHLVHTECLQEWMNVRAICPVCRTNLPSLS